MRWFSLFFCIFICIIAVKSHPRPKRDLETILKIKKAIASSIFGIPNCNSTEKPDTETIKLYQVPGHKDLFIKAVPIVRRPIETVQLTPIAVHPTIAAVGSYLGTTTAEETLQALDRVQKLLQSGILRNTTELNNLLMHADHLENKFGPGSAGNGRPVFPLESIYENVATGVVYAPPKLSYSQSDSESLIVKEENSVKIPEAPILPSLQPPAFIVPERPLRPMYMGPILDAPISIPEYRPVHVHKITKPNGYSYQQIHNDGSVTTYSTGGGISYPEFAEVPTIVEEVQDIPFPLPVNTNIPCGIHSGPCHLHEVLPPIGFSPVNVHKIADTPPKSGYSYHQIHHDGSVSTFTDKPVKVPDGYGSYIYQKIKEDGTFESFLDADCIQPLPSNYFSARNSGYNYQQVNVGESISSSNFLGNRPKLTAIPYNQGGYIYEEKETDGTITLYFDPEGKIKLPKNFLGKKMHPFPVMHPFMVNRIEEIADRMSSKQKPSEIPTGFVYKQMYNDGSVTTYTGNQPTKTDRVHKTQPDLVKIPAIFDSPDVPVSVLEQPALIIPDYRPVEVKPIPPAATIHEHHHINHHHTFVPVVPNPILAPFPRPLSEPKPHAPTTRPELHMPLDGKPMVSNNVYTHLGEDHSETHFTVVNIDPPVKPIVLPGDVGTESEKDCDSTEDNLHVNCDTEKVVVSLADNPIIVASEVPNPYSYIQANNDGSSVSYEGTDDSNVSVNVNTINAHRGDIP